MKEEQFWDNIAESLQDISFEPGIYESEAIKQMGDIRGKKILDCGVGTGLSAMLLSERGARVFGFDVSSRMLQIAKHEVPAASFSRMKGESLGFRDEEFDGVFGFHVLHHTCVRESIPEIHRVLKKGARGVFVENFGLNPLLNFSRNHIVGRFGIPKYGTPEECPFTPEDLRIVSSYFKTRTIVPDFLFMKLLACRVFRFKSKLMNMSADLFDRWIHKGFPELSYNSYTQLIVIEKS
jgi:ubiquinone/menaquinone biosynthesis C-methylase UbiE